MHHGLYPVMMPNMNNKLDLKECSIQYVDNLGQGVDKGQDKITLVPKSLPGEKLEIRITHEQSKIRFGEITNIIQASPHRQVAKCIHYERCFGCHYLHTSYDHEIELKKQQAEHLYKNLNHNQTLQFVSAPQRLAYRNRIQLHYSKKKKLLGFIDSEKSSITEVPECLIIEGPLKTKLQELYKQKSWLNLVESSKDEGHIELYRRGKNVQVEVNQSYAHGGFSQVNQAMNDKLIEKITQVLNANADIGPVLDLFGGEGNLSRKLSPDVKVVCVDQYQKTPKSIGPRHYYHLDLYEKQALGNFQRAHPERFKTLIVDPPRSGFDQLKKWSDEMFFENILYISCNPQTQVRDIKMLLDRYEIKEIFIFDLFPGTFHFEGFVFLKRKH